MTGLSTPVWQVLISSFFVAAGINLNWLFLNFHLETLTVGRTFIGFANAVPAITTVVLGIPMALLIPRLGYVQSLVFGGSLAGLGELLVAWAPNSGVVLVGLLGFGLGNVLLIGTTAPLLIALVSEERQVLALSWQGALAMAAAFLANLAGGFLATFVGEPRGMIYLAALAFLLSVAPLTGVTVEAAREARQFRLKNPEVWSKLLLPGWCIGLGAGLVLPFLNLYLADKFGLAFTEVGVLFALSALAAMVADLVEPALVRRLGKVGAIVAGQGATLPFIVIIAYVPFLPLVTLALFVRAALMNAAYPVTIALAMEHLAEEEKPAYMIGLGAVWNIGWAMSSSFSGRLQALLGLAAFNYLFAGMLFFYGLATYFYSKFFGLRPPRVASSSL